MLSFRFPTRRTILFAAAMAFAASGGEPASAQGRLEARYVASLAGVPLGRVTWVVEVTEDQYAASGSGGTTGIIQVITSGHGTATAQGQVAGGRLIASSYNVQITTDRKTDEVRMAFAGGAVKQAHAEPPLDPAPDRVPVTDAHRRGVVDPMTAVLISVPGKGDPISPEACNRTLPIFDGRGRFDLALSFKRFDRVRAQRGYDGPVVVCRVMFQPIAGHRPSRPAIRYLMATRDIEVWLAPVMGTRVLVPFRIQVPTALGPAVLEATDFVSNPQPRRPLNARTH